jgi:chromosome segregation protein
MVQLRRALARMQATEHKRTAAAEAVGDFEPRYAEHRATLLQSREARWRHQEAMADVRLRLAESQHQARIAQERNAAALQALQSLQGELARLGASERAGSRVVDELDHAHEAAQVELEGANHALQSAVDTERAAREAQSKLEAERARSQQQRQELERDRLAVEAEVRQLEGRSQFLGEQQQQAQTQLEAWSLRRGSLSDEFERRHRTVEAAEHELRDVTATASRIEQRVGEAEAVLESERKAAGDHEAGLRTVEAELGALRTLLDRAQRRGPLHDRGDGWRRLLELIDVEPANRAAVEAALEGWLHAWVARDGDVFDSTAAALGGAEETRETLLRAPHEAVAADIPTGFVSVVELVQAPDHLVPLIAHLLRGVVLTTDRSEAARVVQKHPQLRAVTPTGEIVTAVSYRGGKAADAYLALQARIRAAEQALARERQAALHAAEEVERAAAERGRLVREREAILARLDAVRTSASQAAGALAAAADGVQRETQQEQQVRQQLTRIGALSEQAERLQVGARARQQATGEAEAGVTARLAEVQQEIEAAATTLSALVKRRQETELRAALARQRSDDLVRQLERARQVLRSQGDELAQRRAAEEELAVQPALMNEERRQWLERAAALMAELTSLESAQLPDDDALTALESQLREDEQRNVSLQVELAHADDACAAAAAERDAAQAEVDRCAAALREGGQLVEDEGEAIEEVDWQKTERDVSRLQRRLDAMGAVNLLAPDEYAQVRDRCESLGAQLSDLEQAATQLTELRQRLEEEIDSRFRTVFQSVAVNFQEFFGDLFEGGRATLRLEAQGEGDPLDDGVEILAQTPGKRLQPLTLLSGGERALTALAFLFALQAVNPSPFYVLDEVDAALDDANVVRFNRVLKRLAADQQFLIVTHNHSTMAQAEVLYGVTLADHGVSRMVSVRLQHDVLIPVGERSA